MAHQKSAREGPVIALAREEEAGEMMEAVTEPVVDKSWQDFANCLGVDPDLFFPERGASTREAKEVCRGCVVREDCLEYTLANGEKFGIWGGMSERERRRIRRQRALGACRGRSQDSERLIDLEAVCREAGLDRAVFAEVQVTPTCGRCARRATRRGIKPDQLGAIDRGTRRNVVVDLRRTNRERSDQVHRDLHLLTDR